MGSGWLHRRGLPCDFGSREWRRQPTRRHRYGRRLNLIASVPQRRCLGTAPFSWSLVRMAFPLILVSASPRGWADVNLGGISGLLTVPTAEVVEDGTATVGAARYSPGSSSSNQINDY